MRDHRGNNNKENKRRREKKEGINMPIKQVFSSPEREHSSSSSSSSSSSPGIAFGLLHKDRYRLRGSHSPGCVELTMAGDPGLGDASILLRGLWPLDRCRMVHSKTEHGDGASCTLLSHSIGGRGKEMMGRDNALFGERTEKREKSG